MDHKNLSIVLFDGVCNLCNSAVIFLIKRDHHQRLHFSALQSEVGQQILKQNNLDTQDFDSFILYHNKTIYTKSSAGLKVLQLIGGIWTLLYVLIIIPKPIRDWFYTLIAKNRYKWWGKKDQCMIPTPALKQRFL